MQVGENVLSCPACWSWQLHYTSQVALQWRSLEAFEEMLEQVVREHVARECPAPQLVLALARNRRLL